ncbi:hypothetical protein TIFTF001_028312 [Ficus carica]|uniref:Uncharacterized protein n=1 Tax=Ficus carica TaxID=3494 RepID=A0AA88DPK8_FICCA|nr:hypothetical protein TIFTF001_028312 [Ficus carica]
MGLQEKKNFEFFFVFFVGISTEALVGPRARGLSPKVVLGGHRGGFCRRNVPSSGSGHKRRGGTSHCQVWAGWVGRGSRWRGSSMGVSRCRSLGTARGLGCGDLALGGGWFSLEVKSGGVVSQVRSRWR